MATVYKSKIDAWLAAILAVSIAISLFAGKTAVSAGGQWWVAVAVVALGVGLPLWVLFGTSYRVESDQLHIRSGPFKWHVPVASITGITPTRNPLSSPALSLDRLRIEYGPRKEVMISPRNTDSFLKDIEAVRRVAG
ncbi:PH domain-containing protein [uncultured Nevskia sp.]|uniref:PH domain-containing protein n=1 Tax=uncultured Nevskia sp. TaxID=228950 RepID=UPI0025D32530|nr:PH domain-containing protein [uncultured Nevskia sp.]